MTPERSRVLEAIAALIPRGGRVGVDGIDGAGKTTFADELAAVLPDCVRVRLDDFTNPPQVRYRSGRRSPRGYWDDSFDYARMVRSLPSRGTTTIVDGVFLQRPELDGVCDLVVFLDVPFGEAARRMAVRDGSPDDPDHALLRRYTDAQRRYLVEFTPRERADLVVDNTDVDNPVMTRRGVPR